MLARTQLLARLAQLALVLLVLLTVLLVQLARKVMSDLRAPPVTQVRQVTPTQAQPVAQAHKGLLPVLKAQQVPRVQPPPPARPAQPAPLV